MSCAASKKNVNHKHHKKAMAVYEQMLNAFTVTPAVFDDNNNTRKTMYIRTTGDKSDNEKRLTDREQKRKK